MQGVGLFTMEEVVYLQTKLDEKKQLERQKADFDVRKTRITPEPESAGRDSVGAAGVEAEENKNEAQAAHESGERKPATDPRQAKHFSVGPGFYKIPAMRNIPRTFNVHLLENSAGPSVLGVVH